MTVKRTIIVLSIITASLLFAALAVLSCLLLFVPGYVETKVIPSIIKDAGLEISYLKVRNIGLSGAEISDIKIGPANDEDLAIDSIRLDYTISGLLARKVERIALSGITVNLEYKNNQISIKGLDGLTASQEPDEKSDSNNSKPFTVNKISVTNSVLSLNVDEKNLRVPFDLTTTAFDQFQLPKKFGLEIFPGDNKVKIEGNIVDNKDIKLKLTSHALSLKSFEDLINEIVPLDIKGRADIELSAILSQEPISLTDISASCRLKQTMIAYPGIEVKNSVNLNSSEEPINIQVESKDLKHWEYSVSQTLLDTKPVPVELKFSGTADLSDDIQRGDIKAVTRIMVGSDPPEIKWDITAGREINSDNYKITINGKQDISGNKANPIKTYLDDMLFTVSSPEVNIQAEYNKGTISGSYLLNAKNIESAYNEMRFSIPMVSIKGDVKQSEDHSEKYVSTFLMTGKDIACKGLDITMNIPDYRIDGAMRYDTEKVISTDALFSFKNGMLSMSGNSLKIKNISADVPLYWPPYESSRKGRLYIDKITYENYLLGPVDINILQKDGNIPFSGTITFPALPDMTINISGNSTIEPMLEQGNIRIDIPSYSPESRIDLGKFLPALKGFYYKGNLKSIADINFSNSDLRSELNFNVDNSTIENSENDLSLENVSLNLKLEDLISMKSPFGQKLKIARIAFGDIQAEDFILDFKIDGPSLIFIEKGSFKWCGGHINIQSFRINPEKEEYDLILFCDRLKVSEILAQLGVANASGGGTVNGKLPIKISNNKVSFEDGFLYSTPGGGGKINITETDILTAALDPNSAEYAQMDIAREALKAFEYSWVKMSFETEKDELLLKLQFDGKPENRLPFKYSEGAGKFIRVEDIMQGSDFEGISLDVNFRVPIDRVLNIKDVLDMME